MGAYKTLEKIFTKLYHIDQSMAILHWDAAVMMPSGGADARAEQLATLSTIAQSLLVDDDVKQLLDRARKEKLSGWQKANLFKMTHRYRHQASIPPSLLSAITKAGSKCEIVWRNTKKENDFKTFAPYLQHVVDLVREAAQAKAEAFGVEPYDALLDQYDPGRTSKQLDGLFKDLQGFLPNFIQQVIEKQNAQPATIKLKGPFPIEKQKELAASLMKDFGFNFDNGRLDTSNHPFCGGYPSDVRITTRYNEDCFVEGLMGVLHETGHALYEANLPKKWRDQPVGSAVSLSIHESQSLLIEMQVSRSKAFLSYALPKIKQYLNVKGKGSSLDNLYRIYTHVEPSFIRVDADEVTYPAHVMLRYYIEQYLIRKEMDVSDLPEAWNQGMEKFLGIKPATNSQGCMQDIHWTDGSFGYFPTYTLGAIAAAQLFATIKMQIPDLETHICKGNFVPLTDWLESNIHSRGSYYSSDKLLKSVTGKEIDLEYYKQYLTNRYLEEEA